MKTLLKAIVTILLFLSALIFIISLIPENVFNNSFENNKIQNTQITNSENLSTEKPKETVIPTPKPTEKLTQNTTTPQALNPITTPKNYDGLVLISELDESIIIDLRYATENNFTGKKIYDDEIALIAQSTGEKLKNANELLKSQNYLLKVWDSFRPIEAQQKLWDCVSDPNFVSNPKYPTQHNFGVSVDVTLCDMTGNELEMPTGFDEFSKEASPNSKNMTSQARANLTILQEAMRQAGFKTINSEWWHFNDVDPKINYLPNIK